MEEIKRKLFVYLKDGEMNEYEVEDLYDYGWCNDGELFFIYTNTHDIYIPKNAINHIIVCVDELTQQMRRGDTNAGKIDNV